MTENPLAKLSELGVSIWLDDLSRELIETGDLQKLIDTRNVVGVTTNPTIFANALAKGDRYEEQVRALAARGADAEAAVFDITTDDVRNGCDIMRPVYDRSGHLDGKVSIEVDPRMAKDTEATIESARKLWATVDRPNLFIKIPATREGLPAIRTAISEGISVNVTLIFSLQRYREVMEAYIEGIEGAKAAGRDLSTISSVASFFVSRVDTEIDKRLDAIGSDEAKALRG
jgi:transaldolase